MPDMYLYILYVGMKQIENKKQMQKQMLKNWCKWSKMKSVNYIENICNLDIYMYMLWVYAHKNLGSFSHTIWICSIIIINEKTTEKLEIWDINEQLKEMERYICVRYFIKPVGKYVENVKYNCFQLDWINNRDVYLKLL